MQGVIGKQLASNFKAIAITTFSVPPINVVSLHQVPIVGRNSFLNFTFMEGTEKIFCSNPSMDAMGMAAMMNGGMGANNWLNNPLS